jgi:hypothetical protein
VVDWLIFGCQRSCAVGENLWVAVGEWVVNGGGGFVGCQWRRWRFVSVMRIGKFWGKKKKKADENGQSCEERENNNILIK